MHPYLARSMRLTRVPEAAAIRDSHVRPLPLASRRRLTSTGYDRLGRVPGALIV